MRAVRSSAHEAHDAELRRAALHEASEASLAARSEGRRLWAFLVAGDSGRARRRAAGLLPLGGHLRVAIGERPTARPTLAAIALTHARFVALAALRRARAPAVVVGARRLAAVARGSARRAAAIARPHACGLARLLIRVEARIGNARLLEIERARERALAKAVFVFRARRLPVAVHGKASEDARLGPRLPLLGVTLHRRSRRWSRRWRRVHALGRARDLWRTSRSLGWRIRSGRHGGARARDERDAREEPCETAWDVSERSHVEMPEPATRIVSFLTAPRAAAVLLFHA